MLVAFFEISAQFLALRCLGVSLSGMGIVGRVGRVLESSLLLSLGDTISRGAGRALDGNPGLSCCFRRVEERWHCIT